MDQKEQLTQFLEDWQKIRTAFLPQENTGHDDVNNIDVLQGKQAMSQGYSVRIKDAILIYPRLRPEQFKEDEEISPGSLIAIPNTDEVKRELMKAYESAFNYGKNKGTIAKANSAKELFTRKPFFYNSVDEMISEDTDDRESKVNYMSEIVGENKIIIRNSKVGVRDDGTFNIVLRDKTGHLLDDDDIPRTGDIGEIVINFNAYNYQKKEGISRYIQGFKRSEDSNKRQSIAI